METPDEAEPRPPEGWLRPALERLSEESRKALELKYVEGYTNDEAAKKLGISFGKFRHRLRRALEELRRELGEGGPRDPISF